MLGMWVWQNRVMHYGAEHVAENCARAGVTDLFFLTKGLAGTAAFRSACAPASCGRDLLRELTDAAHKRGMRVHAWFTSACDEHYKQRFPESGRCHLTRGKDRELISLADEGYLDYLQKIVQEVCRGYEIDGLHLDYIRYNHLLYGWAAEDLERYRAAGADTAYLLECMNRMYVAETKQDNLLFDLYRAGDESVLALARARRMDVVRFAQTLTQAARAEKPGIILSAALMPEGAYEDIAFADLHYGQNYADAAALYDYVLPMAYSAAYGQDAAWVRRVAEGTKQRGLQTIVGLHAFEGGTGPRLQQDLAALEDSGVAGVCLFREGACALAYSQGGDTIVYNALDEPITRVENNEQQGLDMHIAPGTEAVFHGMPAGLRVFCGEKKACVYVAERKEKA